MPSRGSQFITDVEALMDKTIGRLVGRSILNNQLKKLQKDTETLSAADCNAVVNNIVNSLSIFVSKQEVDTARYELDRLYRIHFC